MTTIVDKSILVTGGNRGIGRALVSEALHRGAKRVYVGTRKPMAHSDARITVLPLDVTDADQIRRAVGEVGALDILVNNAGIALYDDLSEQATLEQHLAVNLFGTFNMIRAFLPLLTSARGAVVNNLSVNALAPLPLIPAYSVSKAAAFSMTQSLRTLLADQAVAVHAVMTGIVDTDMTRGLDAPKATPDAVARAIFDGVEADEEDIFPDAMSASMAPGWRSGPAKALERQYAALASAELAKAQVNSG